MVIGAVAGEVADCRADARALVLGQPRPEVERIGNAKTEQPAVEILALLRIGDVDAEMTQAPDAERPPHAHAAHLELCRRCGRSEAFGLVHKGSLLAAFAAIVRPALTGNGRPRIIFPTGHSLGGKR